ncbi:hypothetical protein A7J57_22695 [Agrobacterium tumefaciens]|uniref:Uncharacterized protein n=1 Tax=Agrobacterium tumefaciens TaxID=358 RepID=A0A176XG66_AGRTU|nr:hypothetical protein A7J57_22695 [Agrobacterium tumefaciens]
MKMGGMARVSRAEAERAWAYMVIEALAIDHVLNGCRFRASNANHVVLGHTSHKGAFGKGDPCYGDSIIIRGHRLPKNLQFTASRKRFGCVSGSIGR